MSSDTSSEEEIERFKEAVDKNFLTEELYHSGSVEKDDKIVPIPSLRNDKPKFETHNPYSIKVTPEFQKHIAQHLDKKLDELIDDSEVFLQRKKLKKRDEHTGVKLLLKSKGYLNVNNNGLKQSVYKKETESNSEKIFQERAKQVAVSPEWVLSQKETEHWAPCTKGEVEIIKVSSKPKNAKKV